MLGGPTSTVCAERSDPAIAVQSVNVIETNLRLRVSVATLRGAPVHVQFVLATVAAIYRVALLRVGDYPLKNNGSHIDASLSRQPLVKGERLVRAEMNAVIITNAATARYSAKRLVSWLALPEGSVGIIASVARACAIPLRLQRSCDAAEARALLSRKWRAPLVQGSAASPRVQVSLGRHLGIPARGGQANDQVQHRAPPSVPSRQTSARRLHRSVALRTETRAWYGVGMPCSCARVLLFRCTRWQSLASRPPHKKFCYG